LNRQIFYGVGRWWASAGGAADVWRRSLCGGGGFRSSVRCFKT